MLAKKGPDAPLLASFVRQPTYEKLCAKVSANRPHADKVTVIAGGRYG
jgi:hypothetical protein